MRLLITGGCGFIGSNVIRHIIDKPEVEALANLDCLTYAGRLENVADVSKHPKYRFERIDLRDAKAVRAVMADHRISHVLHLAAESHVDRSIDAPADFIRTNINGTFHLLEACRALWPQSAEASGCDARRFRFHHVSTDEVYGSLGATGYFTEKTAYAPNSPYSASKAASDMLVRAYHHTYGLPVVITNCSNNYGPYQHPEKLIPVVIRSVLARENIPVYGDGMHVRDWLFVEDHAEALWKVLCSGRIGETYNIGGNNERPNIRIVESVCDLLDELKPDLGGSARKLITFVKDRPGHDRRYAIDASKIREELGWSPRHGLEEGLRLTVRWYLENLEWLRNVTQNKSEARNPKSERNPKPES